MTRIIEIRSYNLKAGTRATFEKIANGAVRPMLEKHGMDVVAARASLADETTFYLIRAYRDAADRDTSQASFYGGAAWRDGPRESVLACIESYATIVLEADDATIDGLRDRDPV